jgi:carotenoid cleavage dioxygenase-like enzyme
MADSQSSRAHPTGLFEPVRSEDDFDLKVVGRIPDALAGAYYRNGPNPQFDPQGPYFPFLGDGMIHAFFLEPNKDGRRARYRNRWVRTPKWHAENKAGRLLFYGFGTSVGNVTPTDPSAATVNSSANIHVVFHAGELMALGEHGEPFELDPQDLERGAFMNTGGKRTAHPKIDPETGEMVWFAYFAGSERFSNLIDYGVTDKSGNVTRRDRFAAPYAAIMHDFMVTRNYVMFAVTPLAADPARPMKGMPPVAWEPTRGAFVGVMKRNANVDSMRWFEIEPRFFIHTMNAWEDGEKIHCEVTEFPNPPDVFPNADGSASRTAEGRLVRWTIDLAGKTNRAKREQVDDLDSEVPRVDDRFGGLPYRHGWYMANIHRKYPQWYDAIAHIDLKIGKRTVRTLDPWDAAGEPVFVPRSASAPEGDGYIVSVVYRAATNTSELLILNAQDIAGEPAVVLKVPRRVPPTAHGNFVAP